MHLNVSEMKQVVENMNGQVEDEVKFDTNYLVMGDHDFFRHDNEDLETARQLIKQGAKIKRLSESYFLTMLDNWARS